MKTKERIIWNSEINPADWETDYLDHLWEDLGEKPDHIDQDDLIEWANDSNSLFYDDEEYNLNKKINDIICIADLGFWNGRRSGYRLMGNNLNSVLYICNDCEYIKIYSNGRNICSTQAHHDGTHYLTYRERRSNVGDLAWDRFKEKVMNGEVTSADITRCTKSLVPYLKEIYGW